MIELVKVSKIKANPNNPRKIDAQMLDKLVKSILDFPEMLKLRPIVVNNDMMVLGGNMRLKACRKAGLKEIYIIKSSDLTDEQQKEFIIKDNVSFGEWNMDELKMNWNADQLSTWGLELDLKPEEIIVPAEDDEFEMPNITTIHTNIVEGDMFQIGNHRLICGDSTQIDTFNKLMDGKLANLVLTDPPYNVNYEGGTSEKLTIANDKMSKDKFYKFLYDAFTAMNSYCAVGCAWYIWHADSEGVNFRTAMINAGIMMKQCLIWVKNQFVMGRQDYQWIHEPCLYGETFSEDHQPVLYGWKPGEAHYWNGGRKQSTILQFDKPLRNAEHPTMKQIPLFGKLIENSSKVDDIVLDGFGGSGTTMVSCHQLRRSCYLVEYDPKYCDVILKRMTKLDPTLKITKNGIDETEKYR